MTSRYINGDLAIKDIQETYCKPCKKSGGDYHGVKCRACWVGDCICIIEDCEEADVQPVVHAKWIDTEESIDIEGCDTELYKCSHCQSESYRYSLYCHHCGAKMDGNENEAKEQENK